MIAKVLDHETLKNRAKHLQRKDKMDKLANQVAGVGMSVWQTKAFIDTMLNEHRTLQQAFTRVCRVVPKINNDQTCGKLADSTTHC